LHICKFSCHFFANIEKISYLCSTFGRMKMQTTILFITILVSLLLVSGFVLLHHPAFGRRVSSERKARIESSPNWRDGQFQNQIPTQQFTGDKNSRPALWDFFFRCDTNRVPQQPLFPHHYPRALGSSGLCHFVHQPGIAQRLADILVGRRNKHFNGVFRCVLVGLFGCLANGEQFAHR